jgi:hypothetical protein
MKLPFETAVKIVLQDEIDALEENGLKGQDGQICAQHFPSQRTLVYVDAELCEELALDFVGDQIEEAFAQ